MFTKNNRNKSKFSQPKSDYKEKTIDLRRVARVMAGGKRFSFRCTLVIGDDKGNVGIGIAKGIDVAKAMEKAKNKAKKNLFNFPRKETTIPHEVEAKESSATVMIQPAKGRGMVAGSSVRNVLELAGIKDVRAKILSGSKNKLNNARATIKALKQLRLKGVKAVAESK